MNKTNSKNVNNDAIKKILAVLLAILVAIAFTACGSSSSDSKKSSKSSSSSDSLKKEITSQIPDKDYSKKTIGFVGMTLNNEYHIILANAVKKSAEAAGIKVEIQAGSEHASVDEQLKIIENYIEEGVDGIILVPASSKGLVSALQKAKKANIPIINLDTKLDDSTLKTLNEDIPFYGTNNYNGGKKTGKYFAQLFPKGGKVAILRGVEGQTNDDDRYNGFLKTAGSNVKVVAEQHANWETDKAYTATQNIIQSNPDIDAIYTENDLMGLGAYRALNEAGKADDVKIFSFDGVVAGLEAVQSGHFASTCAQQPIEMGKLGVINMAKIFAGEKAKTSIDTGCKLITKKNVDSTLKETKKYTAEIKASK